MDTFKLQKNIEARIGRRINNLHLGKSVATFKVLYSRTSLEGCYNLESGKITYIFRA